MPTFSHTTTFLSGDGRLDISRLFSHYSKPLFYYALKFVDEESAKDIVQDVFFKLWEDQTITVARSLNGLLFTMVRNKCLQQIEKQKVRDDYRKSAGTRLKEDEILFYSTGSSSLIELELQKQLEKAVASLPEKCREVFILSRFQNKMNKEIAEELGISIKTVEKHISSALKFIRTELKDYLPLLLLFQQYFFQNKN
jgi:RNA polymerase sigma-70 factor (ECF subfamily)